MPRVPYAIAWIATNQLAFQSGLQILNPSQGNSVWRIETPRDPDHTVPFEYTYNRGQINGHTVFIANAVSEDNVSRLAGIMMNRLQRTNVHIRVFLVTSLAYIDDYNFLPLPLTPNDCLFDTFPIGHSRVSPEAERNGQRLLTAATSYQDTQLRDNHVLKSLFLYDYQDAGVALSMGRVTDFFGMPSMALFGLCYRGDVSENAQINAYTVAGIQIHGVLGHLEGLEARV